MILFLSPSIIKVPLNILCRQCSEFTCENPKISLSVRFRPIFKSQGFQVGHFIFVQRKAFTQVVSSNIIDETDCFRNMFNGENILIKFPIQGLKHGI